MCSLQHFLSNWVSPATALPRPVNLRSGVFPIPPKFNCCRVIPRANPNVVYSQFQPITPKNSSPEKMSPEKLKLELKKVVDEFKMSELDSGSSRVQVAVLTTKIKHLSSALHKKDKQSIKGLRGMVKKRTKLLKYLRRTDRDSYSLVLSKLGIRGIPEII